MEQKIIFHQRPPSGSQEIKTRQAHLVNSGWGGKRPDLDKYRMNSDKLSWHKERLLEWAKAPESSDLVPLHIDMGVATGCNLACTYCYGVVQARTGFQGKQGAMTFMPAQTMRRFFNEADALGVRSIALIGEGENTLNPAIFEVLQETHGLAMEFSLATHGASLKAPHYRVLLESLTWLRVNISAGTEEGYKKIHQRPWFNRVIENTRNMIALRDQGAILNKSGSPCTIGWQMVVTRDNFGEVQPLARLAVDLGVDYLVIKACSDTPDKALDAPDEEYISGRHIFEEAEALSNTRTSVIVRWEKLGNMGDKSYSKCFGTRFIIAISGNGNVFPCGHWFDIEKDRFLMGNINNSSFSEILASSSFRNAQAEILNLDLRNCETNCRQHQINIKLDSYYQLEVPERAAVIDSQPLDQVPQHVNFI